MVFFNDPLAVADHELQAVRLALAAQERFAELAQVGVSVESNSGWVSGSRRATLQLPVLFAQLAERLGVARAGVVDEDVGRPTAEPLEDPLGRVERASRRSRSARDTASAVAPSSPSIRTVSAPMPRLPPVTTATRPVSPRSIRA